MRNNKLLLYLSVAFATLFCFSCNGKQGNGVKPYTAFSEYKHTPLAGWEKNDTLFFAVPEMQESGVYKMNLLLRTDNSFPFKSIDMVVRHKLMPHHGMQTDTVRCAITDDQGRQKGSGINLYQHSFFVKDIALEHGDSVKIWVNHNMMRDMMPGISDVGIEFVFAKTSSVR